MKVGAMGHQRVPAAALDLWRSELRRLVMGQKDVVGICSLADGADQEFASVLLEHGGALELVIPCRDYANGFTDKVRARFENLRARARSETVLPYPASSDEAFMAAGLIVVERSERLVALWDGEEARGLGGTADIVQYARGLGRQVDVVWPHGVLRGH
jgi:hypothetical protein